MSIRRSLNPVDLAGFHCSAAISDNRGDGGFGGEIIAAYDLQFVRPNRSTLVTTSEARFSTKSAYHLLTWITQFSLSKSNLRSRVAEC